MEKQIVIAVNGPGEVSCWLYPLAKVLKEEMPEVRICVALVPSVLSAGAEIDVVRSLPYIDAVSSVADTRRLLLQKRLPEGFQRPARGFVLHLGGEPFLTWLIARRMKQPCLAYVERPFALQARFEEVFYSGFETVSEGEQSEGATVVGELAVDAALLRCPKREPFRGRRITVGLYPGSRDAIVKYTLPFFGAVADRVAGSMPDIEWILAKSDYLTEKFLEDIPDANDGRPLEGVNLRWESSGDDGVLVTEKGNRIEILSPSAVVARANVALAVPGSNTAELASLGIPMVIALPTQLGETSPLPGLAGQVGRIPLVGRYAQRGVSDHYLRKMPYASHPNRRGKRMVAPEVIGEIDAKSVAEVLIATVTSDTKAMEEELKSVMGPPGAAKRLVDAMRAHFEGVEKVAAGAAGT